MIIIKQRAPSRQRYCVAIALLIIPMALSIVGSQYRDGSCSLIPTDWLSLGWSLGEDCFVVGGFFALAYWVSAIRPTSLRLGEMRGFKTFSLGLLWSILLRISLIPLIILITKITGPEFLRATGLKILGVLNLHSFEGQTGKALLFFAIISCMAGGLEELWRAGMFAGLRGIYPEAFERNSLKFLMIIGVSGLFGIAHLYQGWAGVIIAFFIGIGLGAVQLFRKSYWEAAVAHTLFDFASFSLTFLFFIRFIK